MATITLQQHFYGSAPVGLSGGRGWKSMAPPPGLVNHEILETPIVSITAPKSGRIFEPINWGWFPLDSKRACLPPYRLLRNR